MKIIRHNVIRIIFACAISYTLSSCAMTTIRMHPEFEQRRQQINSIATMPPDVEVVKVKFKGDNEQLTEEAYGISEKLMKIIDEKMKIKGFAIKPSLIDDENFSENPDLRFETTQIKSTYADKNSEMYKKITMPKKKAKNYKTTLGPAINQFADHADVDALMFAKMSGWEKSGGEVTKDVVLTVLIAVATLGNVAVVQPTMGAS